MVQATTKTGVDARELRIGNWVNYTGMGSKGENDYCFISNLKQGEEITGIQPIPLTPEILEKIGFVPNGKHDYDYYGVHSFDLNFTSYTDGSFEFWLLNDTRRFGEGFKYLHQLQNLYYSLIGEELEINDLDTVRQTAL